MNVTLYVHCTLIVTMHIMMNIVIVLQYERGAKVPTQGGTQKKKTMKVAR